MVNDLCLEQADDRLRQGLVISITNGERGPWPQWRPPPEATEGAEPSSAIFALRNLSGVRYPASIESRPSVGGR